MNKIYYKNKSEWLQNRSRGIGGSDASCIVGMNQYKSNVDLWEIKTGRNIQEDISDKPYVRYGTLAEEYIRSLFKLDFENIYEVTHDDDCMIIDDEYEFLYASLDGELVEKETGRKGILEIKTVNMLNSRIKEKWNKRIPDNYYIQVLHYLMITKYDFVVVVAQFKTEISNEIYKTTKHYKIERADVEEDIRYLREKEIEFWQEYVQKDIKPNLIINI